MTVTTIEYAVNSPNVSGSKLGSESNAEEIAISIAKIISMIGTTTIPKIPPIRVRV